MASFNKDHYPEPTAINSNGGSGVWRVILLALVFIGLAVVVFLYGEDLPGEIILLILGFLSILGVFCLFALASGLLKLSGGEKKRTLSNAIVDSLPYGCVVCEREGKIIYANAQYCEFSLESANGLPVGVSRLFANASEASEAIYRLSRAAREGRPAVEDIRLTTPLENLDEQMQTGAFWYRVSVRALPKSEGVKKPLVLWSIENISKDKDTQENIFLELQRAIDYLDHAPAGFFASDANGRIKYINSTLADWLGYDLAEFETGALSMDEIVRGDGSSLLLGGRNDGEIRTEIIDIDLVHSDGTSLPVRLLHRAARLAEGEIGETRTLVLDRTNTIESEEGLRAAEVRFSRFFNDTPFAIATLDSNFRIVRTNAPFARTLGINAEEKAIEHQEIVDFIAPDAKDKVLNAIKLAMENKADIEPIDIIVSEKDEKAARIFVTSSEKIGDSDERIIVYALDTSVQRKLEAQFAQGQKMHAVGELAGGIAHDFNNVLTAIIGFSDLLLLKHKNTDPSFNDIKSIKDSADRAAGLVSQLLAFSRRQTLRPQILDVQTQIDELQVLIKPIIREKTILEITHQVDLWNVKADNIQFDQVIVNLCVNANHAMPDGGKISIRTSNVNAEQAAEFNFRGMIAAEYVMIEVEDTGTGMSEEILEKIFEPFFSTKEVGEGTGLGLSTVYGIVKQSGGFIYPQSIVGVGTKFLIFLPRYIPVSEEMAKEIAPIKKVVKDLTGNERILIVEDEEAVRAFSARALSATGYEVFEADGGEEALEVLDDINWDLDLLISDVVMPEMDGPTLLIEIRKRLPDLKVIFVSGYAEESVRNDLADNRSVEFLGKPYTLKDINEKVKNVLLGSNEDDG